MRVPAVVLVAAHAVFDIDPGDNKNIAFFFAFDLRHAVPHNACENPLAPWNMLLMLVTLDTSHFEMLQLKDVALQNIPPILVTLDTSHLEISLLKAFAPRNMEAIVVTRDTSHFEMSPLKDIA